MQYIAFWLFLSLLCGFSFRTYVLLLAASYSTYLKSLYSFFSLCSYILLITMVSTRKTTRTTVTLGDSPIIEAVDDEEGTIGVVDQISVGLLS